MRRVAVILLSLAVVGTAAGVTGAAFLQQTTNSGNSFDAASSFACPYSATMLGTGGLVSYWRLGEAPGATTATDSKGTNSGTYTNGPTLGQAGALPGNPDTSVSFDGVNDWVAVPDNNSLDLGDVVSIEAWVKRSATGQDDAILDKMGNAYKLYFRAADNKLTLRKNGVADIVASTTAITDTSWHHVAATKNGTTSKLYIDGADVTGTVTNQTFANNASNLAIGDNGSASQYFNGLIDEVALYGTALSAAQVQAHEQCGRRFRDVVLDTSGLLSYWRLNEASGTIAHDSKGANDGTYANGVTLGGGGALTAAGNRAASFDGTDDRVDFGDVLDFAGTANFSLEAWINRGTLGAATKYRWIITKNTVSGSREGWGLFIAPDTFGGNPTGRAQQIGFERWSADVSNSAYTTTATVAGTWYHVVATYDGATMRIYLNGALESSNASSFSVVNTTLPVKIGSNNGSGTYYDGLIDEVAVYNRALSATEVSNHYLAR